PDSGSGSSRRTFSSSAGPLVASLNRMVEENGSAANRRLFWGAVWLALVLIGTKSFYLGLPKSDGFWDAIEYVRSLAAISYADLWFVTGLWALARLLIIGFRGQPTAVRVFSYSFATVCAFFCLYAVVNVVIFGVFGGFLT